MNNDEIKFLNMVINLCDNLAFGRAADESTLFSLTRQGSAPEGGPLTLSDASLYDGTRAKPVKSLPNAPKPSKGAKEPAQ